MKPALYLSSIALLILFSCNDPYIKEDTASINVSNIKRINISDSFTTGSVNILSDSISVIRMDTTVSIGTIDKLIVTQGGCFILDNTSDNIIHINDQGNIVWDLNTMLSKERPRKNKIKDFALRGNRLYIMDGKFNLTMVDTGTGKPTGGRLALYNRRYQMVTGNFFVDPTGNFVICDHNKTKSSELPYKIGVLDPTGKKMLSLHYAPPFDQLPWLNEHFPLHPFSDNSGFFYSDALNDTIYAYKDTAFQRAYVVDFGSKKTPLSEVTSRPTLAEFSNTTYAGNISQVVDLDGMVCFRFYWEQRYPVTFFNTETQKARTFFPLIFSADPLAIIPTILCSHNGSIYFSIDPQQVMDAYANFKKALYATVDKGIYESILQRKYPLFYKLYNGLSYNSNPIIISARISRDNVFPHG